MIVVLSSAAFATMERWFSHVNRLVYETDARVDAGRRGTGALDTYMDLAMYVFAAMDEVPPGISLPSRSARGSE